MRLVHALSETSPAVRARRLVAVRTDIVGRNRATFAQTTLLPLTAACAVPLTVVTGQASSDALLLGCLAALWLLLAVNFRSLGAVAVSLGVLTVYAAGPWLAALAGTRHPPFYRVTVLREGSSATLATVAAALGLVAVVLMFLNTRKATEAWRSFAVGSARPRVPGVLLIGVVTWGLMVRDLIVLVPVVDDALDAPRRAFADLLWVTSTVNVQLLYLCGAAVATLTWPRLSPALRWLLLPPLLAALLMQLAIGSRKEVLLGFVIALPVLWLRQSRRGFLALSAAVLIATGLALPILRDGDVALMPTEFALPGYASVAAFQGQISHMDIPYNFWLGAWGLLPSELRFAQVDIDIGTAFAQYGFQSVGIGATPWLEASLAFPGSPLVAATLIIAGLHLGWQILLRPLPVLAVTAWPFLLLLGRSTFWITVFGALYLTLLTSLAITYDRRVPERASDRAARAGTEWVGAASGGDR